MADKLPDEILKEILSPSLHVPDEKFTDTSGPSVFFRFDLSTSAFLLVCKRWLRVATPLLYEVVVLCSKAQAQALSQVFATNKQLGTFVKKLRVEGGYGMPMEKIIKASPNIKDLYLSLALYSTDSVSGICRSLSSISPTRLILYESSDHLDNASTRQLTKAICASISSNWKALGVFHTPYVDRGSGKVYSRWSAIISALSNSPSLREVTCSSCPYVESLSFHMLAKNPHLLVIRFKLKNENEGRYLEQTLDKTSRLAKLIQFDLPPAQRPADIHFPVALPDLSYIPMATTSIDVRKKIWAQILSFAMWNDWCDRDFVVADVIFYKSNKIGLARQNLLTVSKEFYEIGLPLIYSYPVLLGPYQLCHFATQIATYPALGSEIRSIFFHVTYLHGDLPQLVEESMARIVAATSNLTRLHEHCDSRGAGLPMKGTTFLKLVETSGSSLITLTGIKVSENVVPPARPPSFSIFDNLRRLRSLEWRSTMEFQDTASPTWTSYLPSLEYLKLQDCSNNFLDNLSSLSLPSLVHLDLGGRNSTPSLRRFFSSHGSKLRDVVVNPHPEGISFFDLCPNVAQLKLTAINQVPPPTFYKCAAPHRYLTRVTISAFAYSRSNPKMISRQQSAWSPLFKDADLTSFPALKEVQCLACEWPKDERAIAKNLWVEYADYFKNKWGVLLVDYEGRHWKSRLKGSR
ncbi:hypothetical protein JAAARDRAFT_32473 [Jaapia argillacea MUCL 33604]|uniref:Uncharacterized protein n=1 Tax=Jaapia argillacea MUCL 33604 TaxID=933084 RepID=A0A067Q1Q3_9AGAM|nr:hypothetical protein JAAARDRAFT_32473 [Jaapia argillacea MUCL 33604]